jgi:predicted GNAT family N-acyltransferase
MEIIIVDTYPKLYQCLAIRDKVFVEEQGVPKELENDAYDASPEACNHVLLKYSGVPAGTGRWINYKNQTAKIQRLSVLAEFRGKGIGKRLLQELEQQARIAENIYCILDSQCHAESFYSQLGYLTVSEQPFDDAGIMHVRMQKTL